jgi:hypothetical protein
LPELMQKVGMTNDNDNVTVIEIIYNSCNLNEENLELLADLMLGI